MKFHSESELAMHLGRAFSAYANKVQNGLVNPYKSFLDGKESVEIKVTLDGVGGIIVESTIPESKVDAMTIPIKPQEETKRIVRRTSHTE